jgi:fructose/tagatose bisphosphate aldolase
MPIIKDYQQVKEIYDHAANIGACLPAFCADDRETLEAILAAVKEYGDEIGVYDLPVVPAWTCRYPARSQMKLISSSGNHKVGIKLMLSDLKIFSESPSPYSKLRIMPHLDHAFPWIDGDVLIEFADDFASVMCDASEKPFDENIKLTAEYVDKVKGKVLVEGGVDEVYESSGTTKNVITTVEQSARFLKETGVDIIVPNVGTEHRSTKDIIKYNEKAAKNISNVVGKILCMHGTSSVRSEQLKNLSNNGFVKINIFTTLAVAGGQAVARKVLKTLVNIFQKEELERLIKDDILGNKIILGDFSEIEGEIKPRLNYVANPIRRDAWFSAVKNRCKDYLKILNYSKFLE